MQGTEVSMYDKLKDEWVHAGGSEDYVIGELLWRAISSQILRGMRTLETGTGLSTMLFSEEWVHHTALENSREWHATLTETGVQNIPSVEVHLSELQQGESGQWYKWRPNNGIKYDLILIDGPTGNIGRDGILDVLDVLAHKDTIIFLDDTNRDAEKMLAKKIASARGSSVSYYKASLSDGREYAQIGE